MKALLITSPGMEDISVIEIFEILGEKSNPSSPYSTVVEFDCSAEELCRLTYLSQSASKIMLILSKQDISGSTLEKIGKEFDEAPLKDFVSGKPKFFMNCVRKGNHNFSSRDVMAVISKKISEKYSSVLDYKSDEVRFFSYVIDDLLYFGLDMSSRDLFKRTYKLFSNPQSLRGTISYAMMRLSGLDKWEKKGKGERIFLDAFCRDGTTPIEAALFLSGFSVNFFDRDSLFFKNLPGLDENEVKTLLENLDSIPKSPKGLNINYKISAFDPKLANVTAAKKNAKVAGANKIIDFSKVLIEDIELKLDHKSVDCMASYIPSPSSMLRDNQVEKLYRILMPQVDDIVINDAVFLMRNDSVFKSYITENSHTLKSERVIYQGSVPMHLKVLSFK